MLPFFTQLVSTLMGGRVTVSMGYALGMRTCIGVMCSEDERIRLQMANAASENVEARTYDRRCGMRAIAVTYLGAAVTAKH